MPDFKRVLLAETAAGRLRLLRLVLALATLGGFALSHRLWLSAGRTFPTVPVFDFLPPVPAPVDLVWLLALAASLAAPAASARRRRYLFAALALAVGLALWADWVRAVLFVLIPQAAALFFLLGANYLQHAHADDLSRWNYARNFLGWVNPLFFNVGLHTAHHEHGDAHWSDLPRLHARIAPRLDPRLVEPGLGAYLLRVFVAAIFVPSLRSRSLRGRTAP